MLFRSATTACVLKAIKYALENERSTVRMLDFSSTSIVYTFRKIEELLIRFGHIKNVSGPTHRFKYIELINGSIIHFHNYKNVNNLRGLRADCIIIEKYQKVLKKDRSCFHSMLCSSSKAEFIAISSGI